MVYGTDPFSAQNATKDNVPSIFGALPYPRSASSVDPSLRSLVTLRFASLSPTVLDAVVVGPSNELHYRIATDTSGQGCTLLKNATGQHVALVEWRGHPTVEARAVGAKLPVSQWLQLSSDRRSRTMMHCGIHYAWTPVDRFLHLFAPGSSEWLVRVTKNVDAILLELSPYAIQLGLIEVAVLATLLLQSGKPID